MSKTPSSRLKSAVAAAEPLTRPSIKTWSICAAEPGQGQARPDEHGPVQLVEVPLVDQEAIDPAEPLGRPGRAQAGRNEVREALAEHNRASPGRRPTSMIRSEAAKRIVVHARRMSIARYGSPYSSICFQDRRAEREAQRRASSR